jgi:type IV secretory pathway protease TraF
MDAPERGALMLVRFIGAALIGWTAVEIALYLVVCRQKNLPVGVFPCVIRSVPLLLGSVVLVKSKALANWVSEKLDL